MLLDPNLVKWTAALKGMLKPGDPLIPGGSCKLRRRFRSLLQELGLQLYFLRRGGATEMFRDSASFDAVADRGRWRNVRTCRIYIDQALQEAAALKPEDEKHLEGAAQVLEEFLSS